ncbi:MAG TPA: thermonuclease family protein [Chryseosolibacter sp.]|nr:thermonuclease family protein [Chryseosolibacter sp.]
MKRYLFLILIFMVIKAHAFQNEFSGKVVNVIDGNTFEVIGTDNEPQRITLAGIDCPELTQDYGDKAKKLLEKLILNKEVSVSLSGKDRWGNYIGVIRIVKNNQDPRLKLLEEGLAWTAERNPIPELESLRLEAKNKGDGLWQDPNAIAPWIYRRQQTMMQAKSS